MSVIASMSHGRAAETARTLQLGGDFVVRQDGRIAYAFRSDGPDDRPPVDELVAAVRNA